MKFNPFTVGLYSGLIISGFHLIWSILVFLGIAQTLMDFILGLHFLNNPFHVQPFNFVTAISLLIVTALAGFVVGYVATWVWNKMTHR